VLSPSGCGAVLLFIGSWLLAITFPAAHATSAGTLTVLKDGSEALAFVAGQRQPGIHGPEPCVIVLDLPPAEARWPLCSLRDPPNASIDAHSCGCTNIEPDPAGIRRAQELGIAWYREKPIDFFDLLEIAGRILDLCNRASAADAARRRSVGG